MGEKVKEGWRKVRLGEVADFKTGKLNSNAATENGQYPFFTCSQETFRTNTYSFDTEAVILGGNNANGIYPIKYFKGKFDAYQRTYVIRAIDDTQLCNRFLFYALTLQLNRLQSLSTGVATKFLTLPILNNLEVSKPLYETQRKIASILSAYDDLIENNNRRIKILEEMAQSIYREWFINFRFPGHEKVKMIDSELGKIPEGWEVKRLSDLVETQYGYTESASEDEVGPKFLRGTDINKTSYIDWVTVPYCPINSSDYEKYRLNKEDIVVIRMADPGKVGIVEKDVEAIFASYLIRLKLISNSLTPYYSFYFLLSETYQGYITGASTGTTRKSASAGVVTGINIIVPQQSLMNKFESEISAIRKQMNLLLDKNTNLRKTRDLLMPKLISREIDVENLDIKIGHQGANA